MGSIGLAYLALSVSNPAIAATLSAPPADDATIIVTASGTEQPSIETGQSISVITDTEIRQRQSPALVDLLATTPGVTYSRDGGIGGTAAVRIRGAEGDHTLVLIDGVRLNDPSSPAGAFNFGNFVTGNVSRIEVLRGPNSVIWGSQAIGGVIDIRTPEPTEELRIDARGEVGSRDFASAAGNVSGKAGPISASIGGTWLSTDGISAFARGTERDGYRNYGANAKLKVALADGIALDLRGFYSDSRADLDGFAPPTFSFGDTDEETRTREWTGYAGLNAAFLDGRFRNRIAFAYTDIDRENSDPFGVTFDGQGKIERFEYQGAFDVIDALTLIAGAETQKSTLRTISPVFETVPTRGRATLDSLYAQAIVRPFAGLTLTGGARRDDHSDFGGETTFGANFAWTPNEGATVLRGTYAEGFKAPTLFQLQSDFGNVLLRPERARSVDIGIEQSLVDGQLKGSVTWFRRRTRDQIDFISCLDNSGICENRASGTYDNIARARAEGVEVVIGLTPVDGFDVRAQYSYVEAENRSPGSDNFGNRLARRPAHSASVLADYAFPFGLSVGATFRQVSDSFDNVANTRRLDGYALVDIRASFAVTDLVEVYGRIENLFDADYAVSTNYGTLGRTAVAGVRLRY